MLSLNKLTIKGFKSIKELVDFELTDLNIIIGGNGAGKSNFISFFKMLREIMNDNLDDYVNDNGGATDLLFNGLKVTEEMDFEMFFGERGYKFTLRPKGEFCYLREEARYYESGSFNWWPLGQNSNSRSYLVEEAKGSSKDRKYSKPVYDTISSWQVYHFHDTSKTSGMRQSEIIQDKKNLRTNAANIAPFLLKLKQKHIVEYKEIINTIKLVIPYFNDFILEAEEYGTRVKVNLSWFQKGSDYPMQPHQFSDGTIRFICLVTALLQPYPPSIIIIDEPELGLHPAAISILSEVIQDASKRSQVIVATQSPALIDNFSIEDIVVIDRKDGASTFNRLEETKFDSWLEEYSIGELWSKNVLSGGPVYE